MATIPMSDVIDWQPLPIDSQDIATKIHLLVSGQPAGAVPRVIESSVYETDGSTITNKAVLSHSFVPVVHTYTAPEHAAYGCERLVNIPEGTNPFIAPADLPIDDPEVDSVGVEEVRDGNPETYCEVTVEDHANWLLRYDPYEHMVGFRAMYAFTRENQVVTTPLHDAQIRMLHRSSESVDRVDVSRLWELTPTASVEDLTEAFAVANYDARSLDVYKAGQARAAFLDMVLIPASGARYTGVLRVYHFYPLVLDTAVLDDVAKSHVRLPASTPRRVSVRGYVAPEREHTITGWPGGDFTGAVAQHQYELGRTVIDFEQAAAPVGMAFESVEAERARLLRTDSVVREANYRLLIGG